MLDLDAQTVEPILEKLIREHGIAKLNRALYPLMVSAPWRDWQRVFNLARNIDRRIKRAKKDSRPLRKSRILK